jgi:putative DNA primase/helicase
MTTTNHASAQRPIPATHDIIAAFCAAMREADITPPGEIKADGNLHRFHIAGHKPGTLNGAYVLHLDGCRPADYFEDFVTGTKINWKFGGDSMPPTPEERRYLAEAAERRKQNDAQRYTQAAETARRLWESAKPVNGRDHPYLGRIGAYTRSGCMKPSSN